MNWIDFAYITALNIVMFGSIWLFAKFIEMTYAYIIENFDEINKRRLKK